MISERLFVFNYIGSGVDGQDGIFAKSFHFVSVEFASACFGGVTIARTTI
jgi:hypothetical protein